MVRCHVDEKNGILELGELEYHKKWYFPNYFRNSVSDPIISKLSANGPFWPKKRYNKFQTARGCAIHVGLALRLLGSTEKYIPHVLGCKRNNFHIFIKTIDCN